MKKKKQSGKRTQRSRPWIFVVVAAVLVACGVSVAMGIIGPLTAPGEVAVPAAMQNQYGGLQRDLTKFEARQTSKHTVFAPQDELDSRWSHIQWEITGGQFGAASKDMRALQASLDNWNLLLGGPPPHENIVAATPSPTPVPPAPVATATPSGLFLPIVLYHYTPADFGQELDYLAAHGYTTIDMAQAIAGLHGGPLPDKPVVLTFDDGFENQMQAFALLQSHNMKATFYIINGGEESRWCIGAGRRYNDPLQPPNGCGDDYLTWDQVRELDRSGLVTIGGHTLDHENLPTLSLADQQHEIIDSKTQIEQEIGHSIHDFAYPYGAYDNTTIQVVEAAGYDSAVTTVDGDYQSSWSGFTLSRIRSTLGLP